MEVAKHAGLGLCATVYSAVAMPGFSTYTIAMICQSSILYYKTNKLDTLFSFLFYTDSRLNR